MTVKEKIELKDGVINLFNRFNTLDNTATIGGLRDDILRYIDSLQEEPVSEDLGDYINELSKQFPEVSFAKLSRIAVRVAKWQKEKHERQFSFINLKDCKDAYNEWKITQKEPVSTALSWVRACQWQKEQMMAKAIDGKVIANGMGNPILHLWDKGKHLIDKKVKVILIKED